MNLFVSRLDEQQRRWYPTLEAQKLGHGGATLIAKITGSDYGKSLQTFQAMFNYIRDTTTETGLKAKAYLVERQ